MLSFTGSIKGMSLFSTTCHPPDPNPVLMPLPGLQQAEKSRFSSTTAERGLTECICR
jgi:hypothetical protein